MWKGKSRPLKERNKIDFFIFASPWLLGLVLFTMGPLFTSLILGFCEWDILSSPKFIGIRNYKKLFNDPIFWKSLSNTAFYAGIQVPLGILLSLFLAVLLNQKLRGITFYRTLYFLPSITPVVAIALFWQWIFEPQFGILNKLLRGLGEKYPPHWLFDTFWVKPAFIIMGLWGAGTGMLIFLAALQGVPQELYEAADLDGVNWWEKHWYITIPSISPAIFFNLVMGVIGAFQIFTQAYVMTRGGPAFASLFYVLYLYQNAFEHLEMGYASAQAWILFAIIFSLTFLQQKISRRWVYYEYE